MTIDTRTLDFIEQHTDTDIRRLALSTPPAGVDFRMALQQIEGRQLARRKLPTWVATPGILFPPRLSLEQCSSEATARYKAAVAAEVFGGRRPATLVDLTGGFGVDFTAMAPLFAHAICVERQPQLVEIVRHNASLMLTGVVECRCDEAETFLREMTVDADMICLDPARRDGAGRKVVRIEDCQPDVAALHDLILSRAAVVLVKLSPMLDIRAAVRALPAATDVHVVSLDGECKEVLVLLRREHDSAPPRIHCARLLSGDGLRCRPSLPPFGFDDEARAPLLLADDVGAYVYESDAALLKAGAFKLVCRYFPVRKLHADTHLYTSDSLLPDFPGRVWRVVGRSTFARRDLRAMLGNARDAEITVRGFPVSVDALRRQLHLRDGASMHLIATTSAALGRLLLRVEPV